MQKLKPLKSAFIYNQHNENNTNNYIEISSVDLINLFINYNIPICNETIDTIKKYRTFLIKK